MTPDGIPPAGAQLTTTIEGKAGGAHDPDRARFGTRVLSLRARSRALRLGFVWT